MFGKSRDERYSLELVLGVLSTRLIHLIFNYRLGLVELELLQNICKGRGVLRCCRNILTIKISEDISK